MTHRTSDADHTIRAQEGRQCPYLRTRNMEMGPINNRSGPVLSFAKDGQV